MKHTIVLSVVCALLAACALILSGQQPGGADITGVISKDQEKPVIAVPDFRGSGDAQKVMDAFNSTLWGELEGSGVLKMAPKANYPLQVPQQPSDFKPPVTTTAVIRGQQP